MEPYRSGTNSRILTASAAFWGWTVLAASLIMATPAGGVTNFVLLGWSEAGMHFVDGDYSVFGIHPLGGTLHAQVVQVINGSQARLLTNASSAGVSVTYEAVSDQDGSINRSSVGKNNFWDYVVPLFGTNLAPDKGFGASMPGPTNIPQPMTFSTNNNWFSATGIPITPYDDNGKFNPYSMMRLKVWRNGVVQTNVDVVLPVTDEMNCRMCHASSTNTAAKPSAGWVNDPDPERDYRLNILRLHDQFQSTNPVYSVALAAKGYNTSGLYAQVTADGKPILCAKCHYSTIMADIAGSGYGTIKPLTQAIHTHHSVVVDPRTGQTLGGETNRTACYTCHGGDATGFLRGAMGNADSTSGQLAIQCQSCHGTMAAVGATNRIGWLSEPNCQACHAGDALTTIGGEFRFASALTNGVLRVPANTRFATTPNVPSNGLSLFRSSTGHSSLMCSACHGSPHAEFPSRARNDNIRSLQVQGHDGVMAECDVCHGTQNLNPFVGGGPHGTHPHSYDWADGNSTYGHANYETLADCGPCHGTGNQFDKRGTVLSLARNQRLFSALPIGGDIRFWQGQKVGCSHCHSGTSAPTVASTRTNTTAGVPVTFAVTSSVTTVRIVLQGSHGMVGLSGKTATYTPDVGFAGTDTFVFASSNAQLESSAATGTVVVAEVSTVNDGIPDWWRQLYFGGNGKTTNALSCATSDPDGDGQNNMQEYIANTDPKDPLSCLRIFSMTKTGDNARVGFASTVSRRYTIERQDDLTSVGAWQTVSSNIWGRTIAVQVAETNGTIAQKRFYRVRVQR